MLRHRHVLTNYIVNLLFFHLFLSQILLVSAPPVPEDLSDVDYPHTFATSRWKMGLTGGVLGTLFLTPILGPIAPFVTAGGMAYHASNLKKKAKKKAWRKKMELAGGGR
jgi:hypothetical protein